MDSQALGLTQINGGSRLLGALDRLNIPVSEAFWYKTEEDTPWRLCVSSSAFPAEGIRTAYEKLNEGLEKAGRVGFGLGDINAARPDSPFVRAVEQLRINGTAIGGIVSGNRMLGGMPVVSLYVYAPEKRSRLMMKLISLVAGGLADLRSNQAPPVVELEDGTSFSGVPVGIRNSGGEMSATFMDFGSHQERQFKLEEVADIVW